MHHKVSPVGQFLINAGRRSPRAVTGGLLIQLKGGLDLDGLTRAWAQMSEVVPELRARIGAPLTAEGQRATLAWLDSEMGALPLRVRSSAEDPQGDEVSSLFSQSIDLLDGPGVRLSVHHGPTRTTLYLEYHGAMGDGAWALRLGEELLLAYGRDESGERTRVPPRFPDQTAISPGDEGTSALDLDAFRLSAAALASGLRKTKARRHGAVGQRLRTDGSSWSLLTLDLDPAYLASLGRSSHLQGGHQGIHRDREVGGPGDDIILRDVSLALVRWRPAAAMLKWPQGCQALLCEQLSRREVWSASVAPAQESLVPFFLTGVDPNQRAQILERIHEDMPLLRRQGLSPLSLRMMARCGRLCEGTAPFVIYQKGAFAGGVSSLPRERDGTLLVRGLRVLRVSLLPSLWGMGSFGIGVVRYRRGFCLSLHYDGEIWDQGAMEGLLALIREELDYSVAESAKVTRSLDQLIARHLEVGRRSPPLHSLPIGKQVSLAPTTLPETRGKKERGDGILAVAREQLAP